MCQAKISQNDTVDWFRLAISARLMVLTEFLERQKRKLVSEYRLYSMQESFSRRSSSRIFRSIWKARFGNRGNLGIPFYTRRANNHLWMGLHLWGELRVHCSDGGSSQKTRIQNWSSHDSEVVVKIFRAQNSLPSIEQITIWLGSYWRLIIIIAKFW